MEGRGRSKRAGGGSRRGREGRDRVTERAGELGVLNMEVSEADLQRARFAPRALFSRHELVLVPRSRGGFSYGRVVKHLYGVVCPWHERSSAADSEGQSPAHAPRSIHEWRVVYASPGEGRMVKELPSFALGKLNDPSGTHPPPPPPPTSILRRTDRKASGGGLEDDLIEGEEIFWNGSDDQLSSLASLPSAKSPTHPAAQTSTTPFLIPSHPSSAQPPNASAPSIGTICLARDVLRAVFSMHSRFAEGERVVAQRSSGGFTYAEVVSAVNARCPYCTPPRCGYRVRVSADGSPVVCKEILAISVGKLFLPQPHAPKLAPSALLRPRSTPERSQNAPARHYSQSSQTDAVLDFYPALLDEYYRNVSQSDVYSQPGSRPLSARSHGELPKPLDDDDAFSYEAYEHLDEVMTADTRKSHSLHQLFPDSARLRQLSQFHPGPDDVDDVDDDDMEYSSLMNGPSPHDDQESFWEDYSTWRS